MERREQNQTYSDWLTLVDSVERLRPIIVEGLLRGTFGSGKRRWPRSKHDPEAHTPPPPYADTTGEIAIGKEVLTDTDRAISKAATLVSSAASLMEWVLAVAPRTVAERAALSVPDCRACGKPVAGRVISGYDRQCYDRWIYLGRPDRTKFEHERRSYVSEHSNIPTPP